MGQHKAFPYTTDPAQIPTRKVVSVSTDRKGIVLYSCPDSCWRAHFDEWCKRRRHGEDGIPEPMPYNHCMFLRRHERAYASYPYGCTDPAVIRAAHEADVRGLLDGWDRDISAEQLDKIVNATVDARLRGEDVGAGPFLVCIYATL